MHTLASLIDRHGIAVDDHLARDLEPAEFAALVDAIVRGCSVRGVAEALTAERFSGVSRG
jgi:hypothetical protein